MNKKFYIEVGAHDGIFQSQTKSLEESGEWNVNRAKSIFV
jgi:hypothetical protein